MRSFSELTALDLVWTSDGGSTIPDQAELHFALYAGQELEATARMTWLRQVRFDAMMECADGTYSASMDLTRPERPTQVWKAGEDQSALNFRVAWEQIVTCGGPVETRSGRKLLLEPTHQMGYEYAVFVEGAAARILTLAAWAKFSIGGNPGHMSIDPASAADADLPALVALALTVANEETRLLHKPAWTGH